METYILLTATYKPDPMIMLPDWAIRLADVIGILGSVSLTVLLVWLYYQQKQLLERSFLATHQAVLEVDAVFPADQELLVEVSNVGNGVALDLDLAIIAVYVTDNEEIRTGVIRSRLDRTDSGEPNSKGGSINEQEREVLYQTVYGLPSIHGGANTTTRTAVRELVEEDVAVARLFHYVWYTDLTGEARATYAKAWEFEPKQSMESVEDITEEAAEMLTGDPQLDPETMDYNLDEVPTGSTKTIL